MIIESTIGKSVLGQPIKAFSIFKESESDPFTLIIGGIHGDERATVPLLENFLEHVKKENNENPICIIPMLNPDGYQKNSRYNFNGVDLNRNFPFRWSSQGSEPSGIQPLSEPESQAIHNFILQNKPSKIVTLHWALSEIDGDGEQSFPLAEAMWDCLSVKEKRLFRLRHLNEPNCENGELSGTMGQWCGFDLFYPDGSQPSMITLELPFKQESKSNIHPLPENSFETMIEVWKEEPGDYLEKLIPVITNLLLVATRF